MRELFVEIRYVELNCILWILPNKPLNLAKAEGFWGFLVNCISVCYKNYSDMMVYFLYIYFFFQIRLKHDFIRLFRKLMDELQTTMTIYRVWGSHLGSSQLFKQHLESRRRITEFVEKVQVRKVFL